MDSAINKAGTEKRISGRNRLPHRFRPGQSGNPKGRAKGTLNKATVDAKELCNRLISTPEYAEALEKRLLAGTAGPMEGLIWAYAKGKPVDRIEQGGPGAFAAVSDEDLKTRLAAALSKL